jgi:hypothetical protein
VGKHLSQGRLRALTAESDKLGSATPSIGRASKKLLAEAQISLDIISSIKGANITNFLLVALRTKLKCLAEWLGQGKNQSWLILLVICFSISQMVIQISKQGKH